VARAAPIQSSFFYGELSPLVAGRVETDEYKQGLETCLGFIPVAQGGVTAAPGTFHVNSVKDSAAKTLLVRFEFSITQAYVIEFGNLYCRFYRDDAQITQTAQAITGITQANPAVATYSGADTYANGDLVRINGVVGMTQVNAREFTVANVNVGAKTFELAGIDSSAYTAYVGGGTAAEIVELTTAYTTAQLFALQFTQSADNLYIAHPSHKTRKITRTSHTLWSITDITFRDGPYLPVNSTLTTITPSATTGAGITLTASAAVFTLVTDVGRFVRILHGAVWGYALITAVASTTSATATVMSNFGAATASTFWRLGVWSDTTGYPRAIAFYEDRLFLAGATNFPQRLDGSKSGDYENFAPTGTDGTVAADNAVSFTFGSRDVNVIYWMLDDEQALVAGTPGGPWIVRPSKQGEALSPTNAAAKRLKSYGSSAIQAVHLGDNVAYVQRDGRKLRSVTYGQQQLEGFSTPDLTLLSEHITRGGLGQMAVQMSPQPILWGVRGDGVLLGMTFAPVGEAGQMAVGWHRHIRGGVFGSGGAVVESVVVIPATDGTRDQLWMIVKRTINGATVRTVEYMKKLFDDGDAVENAFFVDCGGTYSGAPTSVLTGLDHLEGQIISLLIDGAAHPDKTVSAGSVTLDREGTVVQWGLAFSAKGRTLRYDEGAQNGTAQGKVQRIYHAAFRLHSTNAMQAGPTFEALDEVIFRTSDDETNAPIPPFTGDKELDWDGDYGTEARLCWNRDKPMPCTILAIMPQLATEDKN
jgi:hypothetical protein